VGFPQLIPHASADAIDLLVKLLKYDAAERITAREAMRHAYFRDIRENEVKKLTNGSINGIDGVKNEVNSNASVVSTQSKANGSNIPGTYSLTHSLPYFLTHSPTHSLT
jgi:renal tumor antigen